MSNIPVAIVEDEPVVQRNLGAFLGAHPEIEIVAQFYNMEEFLLALKENAALSPAVILLDINLPGMSGLEGIRLIREKRPDTAIIILTTFEEKEKIFKALCAGASSYLSKRTPLQKILEAVLVVNEGGSYMSPAIARRVVEYFTPQPPTESSGLSPRQQEIVEGLINGLSYQLIADQLGIGVETVRSHIKKIYKALEVNSKAELIRKLHDPGS